MPHYCFFLPLKLFCLFLWRILFSFFVSFLSVSLGFLTLCFISLLFIVVLGRELFSFALYPLASILVFSDVSVFFLVCLPCLTVLYVSLSLFPCVFFIYCRRGAAASRPLFDFHALAICPCAYLPLPATTEH